MNKINVKTVPIGVLAGIAGFMLAYAANFNVYFSTLLAAASALPILIVGLGWGNVAAIIAAVVAGILAAVIASPFFALYILAVTLLPAAWLSHLAGLARPANEIGGPEGMTAWYPLSDIMMHLCAAITLGLIVVGTVAGYGPQAARELIETFFQALTQQSPELGADAALLEQLKSTFVLIQPMVQGATSVILVFVAFHFACRIVTTSQLTARPLEDVASSLRMHRNALFVFLAALAMTFFGGMFAFIGAACLGAFGGGFLLAGLARVHLYVRGKPWAAPALILTYLSLLLSLPAIILVVMGLLDTRRTIALSQGASSRSNDDDERNKS